MLYDSGDVLAWLLIALPVGLLATQLMPGRGYGTAGDIGFGLVGALLGGVAVSWLGLQGQGAWLVSILATVAGVVVLTRLVRAVPGRSPA